MDDLNRLGWMTSLQAESSMLKGDFETNRRQIEEAHPKGSEVEMLSAEAYGAYSLAHFGLGDYGQSAQNLARLLSEAERMGINMDGFLFILALIAFNLYKAGEMDLAAQCLGYLGHLPKGLTGWKDKIRL
jgi:hypothetical protein